MQNSNVTMIPPSTLLANKWRSTLWQTVMVSQVCQLHPERLGNQKQTRYFDSEFKFDTEMFQTKLRVMDSKRPATSMMFRDCDALVKQSHEVSAKSGVEAQG